MRCQATAAALIPSLMPPSGLLSYIPTSLSSILPVRGRVDVASSSPPSPPPSEPTSSPPSSPAASPSKMSPSGQTQKQADGAELARVFELFDRNGDGRITREELEDSLGKLGMAVPGDELAAMIARIDADGDGCVDAEEFAELYRAITSTGSEEAPAAEEDEEDMREAFRVFDANGDGYITVDELSVVLSSLGLKQGRTAEECRRMIGQVDRDGDGRVDFHEFRQMMRGGGLAALA
ncbi:probable calcium-binding protein CML22 [Lolium rigidum]|uniref:probable calcium-binding protein CML22 n=1 Tax=Lolium rigidum TaxID=89674 RepID=UPI001F5D378E|nr:probable calcium-binding protein CML22 [Lolium rigidum]